MMSSAFMSSDFFRAAYPPVATYSSYQIVLRFDGSWGCAL